MRCEYVHTITTQCPVNDEVDNYLVIIHSKKMIYVEHIIAVFKEFQHKKILQEDLTQELADRFGCKVKTIGRHSSVRATVFCKPRP